MRWDRGDPLTEKYREISSYVYRHDNPIMLLDFDEKKVRPYKISLDFIKKSLLFVLLVTFFLNKSVASSNIIVFSDDINSKIQFDSFIAKYPLMELPDTLCNIIEYEDSLHLINPEDSSHIPEFLSNVNHGELCYIWYI
jgi:hypothetical protein